MKLSDDQMLNAVNNPWITQENPLFRTLGEHLLNEVIEQLEIISLTRKIFHPRLAKAGEVLRYDKDEDISAYAISEDKKVECIEKGKYVYPNEFEITSYSVFPKGMYREVGAAKNKVKELQEKGLFKIQSEEDTVLIKLFTKVGEKHLNVRSDPYYILDQLIDKLDKQRFICDNILLNRQDANFIIENADKFKDLELFNTCKNHYAKQSLRDAGYIGRYKASMLVTTAKDVKEEIIPVGKPIAVTNGAYVGGMPVRVHLFSEPASENVDGEKRYGWFWYELLSMLVINPNTIVLGEINY